MKFFDIFKARKNTEQRETSILAAQKYGEHVKPDYIPKNKSLLAAQKYGEHVKQNNNEEEYGPVTCIPTVLSSIEPIKKSETKIEQLRELTLLELGEVDWTEFGSRLKQSQLLPPSYDRKPSKVNISLHTDNSPKVEIVFNSKTTDSYRTFKIYNNRIHEFVNGSNEANTRQEIIDEWKRFKKHIIYLLDRNNKNEIYEIKKKGEQLQQEALSLMNIEMLFEEEKKFLDRHKDDVYNFFGYMFDSEKEIPFFVAPVKEQSENVQTAEMVTPFSPKTLEFCVLKLTDEEKFSNAEDEESIESFIQRCNQIKKYSIYKTEKWDDTIEILVRILKQEAERYRQENGFTSEKE